MRIPRWVDYVDLHTCTVEDMVRCDEKQSNEPSREPYIATCM